MNKDLYFIPILRHAIENPPLEHSFREALSEVQSLGKQEQHRQGYQQFLAALSETHHRSAFELGTPIHFVVEQEGKSPRVMEPTEKHRVASLTKVAPGQYRIRLHTGMLLWVGTFTPEQLLWAYAFGDEALPAAAATPGVEIPPSSVIPVIDGELILRTYPGPTTGKIEIEVREPEGDESG